MWYGHTITVVKSSLRATISARLRCAWAAAVLLAFLSHADKLGGQNPNQNRPFVIPRLANEPPDANAIMKMQQKRNRDLQFEAANAERKRQLAEESQILVKLATEVKQEVDRSDPATLRFTAQKTQLIERLARSVQEKMKLTVVPK